MSNNQTTPVEQTLADLPPDSRSEFLRQLRELAERSPGIFLHLRRLIHNGEPLPPAIGIGRTVYPKGFYEQKARPKTSGEREQSRVL